MNKKVFDEIIKQNLMKKQGENKFGYCLSKKYEYYYTNTEFDIFLDEMKTKFPTAFSQYDSGKGSELRIQCVNGIKRPPKMACIASSSRFCYMALRNGGKVFNDYGRVEFEKGCPIRGVGGNAPQLDAYFPEKEIYVEVKCHEIFDLHKIIMKEKYWELIYGDDNDFGFSAVCDKPAERFQISPSVFGVEKECTMFDIKQFLCHLLGISTQKSCDKKAKLIYLFFKPKTDNAKVQGLIEKLFDDLKNEIDLIFNSEPIKNFIMKNGIVLEAIAENSETMEELSEENMIYLFK